MSLPILCYHRVGPALVNGRWLNVEADLLEKHVRYFSRRGYRFICARDIARGSWPSRAVCLTFDDIYVSTVEYGFPVLEEYDAKGSFYAVSGLVGTASTWDGARSAPLAGWEALRRMQSLGHEIGNHTSTHRSLKEMQNPANELLAAHEELTREGIKVETVCFPYGAMDERTPRAVSEAGYRVGLALGKRCANERDNRLCLPRVVVSYSDKIPMLIYKIFIKPKLFGRLSKEGLIELG